MVPISMAGLRKSGVLNHFWVMFNVIVFAKEDGQPAGLPAKWTTTTHNIDAYVSLMDKEWHKQHKYFP